ncbi:hypothetical protein V8C35DRAFT_330081 [Trichoderma chlorosporum]
MSPQEAASSPKYASAELIPFDPSSEAHCARLYEQRVACSWDHDLVEEWREKARKGEKCLFWIRISDDVAAKDEFLARHTERYPNEKEAIVDTAKAMGNSSRAPTLAAFIPIGHIALEFYPHLNEQFALPQSTVWVKSLYISWAIQAGGFGRSAMHQIERLATLPPLSATTMALDTSTKEFQTNPQIFAVFRKFRGYEIDLATFRPSEEWYARQGYSVIGYMNGLHTWVDEDTGAEIKVSSVYMRKNLT